MASQEDDFAMRMKRVRARSQHYAPVPSRARASEDNFDERAMIWTILRPQLALILGAVALILGRAIAMAYLGVAPSTDTLSLREGIVVLVLLVAIGALIGKSHVISHCALLVGASLAFLGEPYYVPLVPGLMEAIYDPNYVAQVLLNAR